MGSSTVAWHNRYNLILVGFVLLKARKTENLIRLTQSTRKRFFSDTNGVETEFIGLMTIIFNHLMISVNFSR